LLAGKHASEGELKDIDKKIKEIIAKSAEFAKTSPEPNTSELFTDVYTAA